MFARPRRRQLGATLLALAGVAALTVTTAGAPVGALAAKPNVVVIMVDDMNVSALRHLPNVRSLLATPGTTFDNSVVSYSLCCPSRSTFLTGQYAHNHGVLGNQPPDGGYEKLPAAETLPVWLRRAGYDTAHIGKFLNGYGRARPTEIPPGWAEWYGSVDPSTYRMWGYTLNENGVLRTYGAADVEDPALYQTDVYARKAVDYIRRKAPAGEPFFLSFAPLAPHGEGAANGSDLSQRNPRPAPRHRGDLENVTLPKPPATTRRTSPTSRRPSATGPGSPPRTRTGSRTYGSRDAWSRSSPWTTRSPTSWRRYRRPASWPARSSCSPRTTAGCRASTGSRAARRCPTRSRSGYH